MTTPPQPPEPYGEGYPDPTRESSEPPSQDSKVELSKGATSEPTTAGSGSEWERARERMLAQASIPTVQPPAQDVPQRRSMFGGFGAGGRSMFGGGAGGRPTGRPMSGGGGGGRPARRPMFAPRAPRPPQQDVEGRPVNNTMAVAALIAGIASIVPGIFLLGVLDIVLIVLAVVFGVLALMRVRRGLSNRKGFAVTGLALGVIAAILLVVVLILSHNAIVSCKNKIGHTPSSKELTQCQKSK